MITTFYSYLGTTPTEIKDLITNKSQYYSSYPLKKRSGKPRYIDAPRGRLKELQLIIVEKIFYQFSPYPIAHGFARGRSPVTNAKPHVGAKILVSLDLLNFFNSITQAQVIELVKFLLGKKKLFNYNKTTIWEISELLTYKERVPQGAPSSPALSNLFCLHLDRALKQLQGKNDCTITRYADDITISSKTNMDLGKIIPHVISAVKIWKLNLNYDKTRVVRSYRRMSVTGIVVNKKLNISRKEYRLLRAKLHNLIVAGKPIDEYLYQQLRGKIEWINNLNPLKGNILLKTLSKLTLNPPSNYLIPIPSLS